MPRQHVGSVRRVRGPGAVRSVVWNSPGSAIHHAQNDEGETGRGADRAEESRSCLQRVWPTLRLRGAWCFLAANIHLIITVLNWPAVAGRQLQDRGLLHREFGPDQETSVKWHDHVYLPRCVSIDTLCGSAVVVRLLNPSSHTWQARSCSAWCRWQSASRS